MTFTEVVYRGYGIDYNIYGCNEYSVLYLGEDYIFRTLEQAKSFIDEEVLNENN